MICFFILLEADVEMKRSTAETTEVAEIDEAPRAKSPSSNQLEIDTEKFAKDSATAINPEDESREVKGKQLLYVKYLKDM